MMYFPSLLKIALNIAVVLSSYLLLSTPTHAVDYAQNLRATLSEVRQGRQALLDRPVVRGLYLENVKIRSHGIDFFDGCKRSKINKHKLLTAKNLPVLNYKGIPIVGSPYHSVPIITNKNNNDVYIKRLKRAIDMVETHLPQSFVKIQRTIRAGRGYLIIDNICPTQGALAYAAFVPRPKERHFVVMVSSTLLLVDELFSDYDVAAQLVHELEGHAVQFFQDGHTDEINAFTKQAAFAKTVGNDKFKDVNNRAQNIRTKIKLKLSTSGTYVQNKTHTPSFSLK